MVPFSESDSQIIIILYDEWERNEKIPEYLFREEFIYELRFMESSQNIGDDYEWDGKMYCRYGGQHHRSWWILERSNKIFLQRNNGEYGNIPYTELDICLYVITKELKIQSLVNELMTYI